MRNVQRLFIALILSALAACGGGGSLGTGNTGGGNTGVVYSLDLTLAKSNGLASSELSQATPLTVKATLSATNDGVIANKVISFTLSDPALASFSNQSGTALTDANGVATIVLLVGTKSGAGQVEASFNDAITNVGFNSAGDGGDSVDVTIGSVSLIADTLQLGTGAGDKVELSALVRDSNNVVVANVPVDFFADSGELVKIDSVTGLNGVAKASLTTQIDKELRDITIRAIVQQQSAELKITVFGTSIVIAAPSSVVLGDTATVDVFLTDSNDNGIQGQQLEVVSALGNTLSNTTPITAGSAAKASFTYTAVNSGVDTLTVMGLGSTNSATINISADAFAFVEADQDTILEVDLNTAQALNVEWLVNDLPNANKTVTFNTTRGVIADTEANLVNKKVTSYGTTDADGKAEAIIRSTYAGMSTISAIGGEGTEAVSAKKIVEFVAVNPTQVEAQAFPTQLGAGESSAIRAIVRDENNNPVKNQTIVFTLDNSAGGVISTGTAVTNSQGIASTVFTADTTTGGGVNGLNLVVNASLQDDNAINDKVDIAVGKRTLFFRFGTGNTITKPSLSTYAKEFSIIVTDSSGNPIANQELNVAVVSLGYKKGVWVPSPLPPESFKRWITSGTPDAHTSPIYCDSEDANFNGILDDKEDINFDGQLTPGNIAVVDRTVTSDESGIATFKVTYPQDVGAWLNVRLQVTGLASGTENVSYREYLLPVSSEDVVNENASPPANPFGMLQSCDVAG